MRNLRVLIRTAIAATLLLSGSQALSSESIPVVATFSILADMVKRIGGDAVSVTTLVGTDGDAHVYQPTPADARAVNEARLLFVNGLQFEGWLDRLIEATSFSGDTVVTSKGIDVIAFADANIEHGKHGDHNKHDKHTDDHHDHQHQGKYDPHGWQSLHNAKVYVDNITTALARANPAMADMFYNNRAAYVADIEGLDTDIQSMLSTLPEGARTVITSHDAFQYFARDYDLTFLSPQGLSTESEASAKDVAQLIKQVKKDGIAAVFVENISDPRLIKQIANETGASIGGKLYPGALSKADGPAASYLDMIRYNANSIAAALGGR